jgi:hypothetical protein
MHYSDSQEIPATPTRQWSKYKGPHSTDLCSAATGLFFLRLPRLVFQRSIIAPVCIENDWQIYKTSCLPLELHYNFQEFFSPPMTDCDIGLSHLSLSHLSTLSVR